MAADEVTDGRRKHREARSPTRGGKEVGEMVEEVEEGKNKGRRNDARKRA